MAIIPEGGDVGDHTHAGVGEGGTVSHADLTGVTSGQHHAQLHAASHRSGGGDEMAKTARVAISVAAGATEIETVTWGVAFADALYTVVVELEEATNELRNDNMENKLAASVDVVVRNTDTLNANTGTLHAIAIHD